MKMKVKLIASTPNPVDIMYVAARTCYASKSPVDIWADLEGDTVKRWKLVEQVLSSGHASIGEHCTFTFAIEGISRACSHQLVRHRTGAAYCVADDTIVKQRGHEKSKTIKRLYSLLEQSGKYSPYIRCVDEKNKELIYDAVGKVIYSGVKPLYEITTEFGYQIKATLQHRFLTNSGWKQLSELSIGDIVYVNGTPAYQDKEWLNLQYNILNKSQEEIGNECGVSKHTVRKWVRLFNLQKEMGSWSIGKEPPNKGKTKPNYPPMEETSKKMMGSTNSPGLHGVDNPSWKGDNITASGGYSRTLRKYQKIGVCSNCGTSCKTHIHHIDKNPRNTEKSNIIELCPTCHKAYHYQEVKQVIIPNKVTNIRYVGKGETYDISMAGKYHNFIANGFVVHNSQQSQRYVEIKESYKDLVEVDVVNDIEKKMEICKKYFVVSEETCEHLFDTLIEYRRLIEQEGKKPEDAREVLPNATKTNITVTFNLRELIHVCNLRLCTRAQKEIQDLFRNIRREVLKVDARLGKYLVPTCERDGFCREHKCCGRKPRLSDMLEK